ncbi:hypothetical protein [Thalassotalea hakodatensis]|uniref:hypothetical protein n=1 Tax=Thalassotalea hakodatensis TaxID=3030492 RepID=UPI00257295EE|nr:hypothetical protein [Thalassotalea hakodatensis]
MKLISLITLILLSMNAIATNDKTLLDAKKAYFHRDYQQVMSIVKALQVTKTENKSLMAEVALLQAAIDIQKGVKGADEHLEQIIAKNDEKANFHYMASRLWYRHAKNSSIFSKMSIYKKHVKASIRAATLAPENERYQYIAARAYGQPSMMGGDNDKQKLIVDKLMINNSAFAQMAMMDYLQNTQDKVNALPFIKQVSVTYKDNIEVLERAAQLLWTFDEKEQAGKLFSTVCSLPPGEFEAYVKWNDACFLSASFAVEGILTKEIGLTSINRLIEFTFVDDDEFQQAQSIKKKLSS